MSKKKVTSLVWFRNNLRVIDNLSLKKSIENSDKVIGYVNIDPNVNSTTIYGFKKTEKFRIKFLLESISDLKKQLKKINISLVVKNEDLKTSINSVIRKYEIDNIYIQKEWTRDELIEEESIPSDINLIKDFDQFLFSPSGVSEIYENIPRGFSNFRKKCEKYLSIDAIIPAPKALNKNNLITEEYAIPSISDLGYEAVSYTHLTLPTT